ncbi:molybdopterin molybdotransferase MoeA [Tahibacter harae]|uniref:Molybdopterin molybdenumtransferase n=1 Tax=Tahibacter harae TaxID=2963937 RepID=A0ABT1QVU3_9GAMM|nr:gephyrin-like molybdotransferase Glp [Tahibacter harae]MCQ4166411.1 molybdopterin molybdotransferase MoeA [Tahibacter harae]
MPPSDPAQPPVAMLSVAQARARVIARAARRLLPPETVELDAALGRILAADVVASIDVPAQANSAMDGFALRSADLPAVGEQAFRLVGTRLAGDAREAAVGPFDCLRITTGAPLPRGADTVVIKENVRVEGDAVMVAAGETAGANVRAAGEDFASGECALRAGVRLSPARVGVLASLGLTAVEVVRAPRAVLLTTGDEIVAPGIPLGHGQVYNSNRYSLGGLLREQGVTLLRHEHVRDDVDALRRALQQAAGEADLVLSSGGVSAGEADFLPRLLAEIGTVDFWKVRMKPGMPLLFGAIGETPVFALPGNPVSGLATFRLLVAPLLQTWAGRDALAAPCWHARLAAPIVKNHRRAEFQRAWRESRSDGTLWVTPFPRQGSGVLRSVAEADCLIVLPEEPQALAIGDCVEILPLD